jgi:Tol biopolymer transport system component
VLYEMLAGGSLFGAGTVTDTLAGVLKNEIDFAQLPPETHAELARLLRRCLERNPKNRLHDIADARIVLDQILSGRADLVGVPAAAASPAPPLWRRALPWVGGVVAGAAVAAILSTRGAGPAARPSAASASIRTLVSTGVALSPAVSPDGRTLAFESERDGENRVWIKDLISGSESVLVDRSSGLPDVSPDGTTVLFVAEGEGEQTDLYRVALATREDRLVARNATYGAWSPDGRSVLFLRDHDATSDGHGELIAVDIASGEERRLHHDAAKAMGESRWSPDGRRIAVALNSMQAGWSDRIGILDVASGAFAELSLDRGGARGTKVRGLAWISPREIALLLLDFGEIISSSGRIAVLEVGRGTLESLLPLAAVGWGLDLSGPGSLIVGIGSTDQNLREVSREAGGRWSPASNLTEGPFSDRQPVYSPDGRSILFTSNRSGNLDIWRRVRATGELRRLTDHDAEDWDPALSPDGKKLLFSSNRSGRFQLWIAESDGSSPRQVTVFENAQNPTMTADGAWIVFVRQEAGEDRDGIWKVRPDGTDAALVAAGALLVPDVSPDGRYVALRGAGRKRVVRIADGAFLEEDLAGTDRYRWSVEGSKTFLWALGGLANRNVRRFPFDPERGALGPAEATEVLGGESNAETFGVAPDGSAMTFASFANRRGQLIRIDGLTGLPR